MTIFNITGGGSGGGLTFSKMWEGTPFEIKPSDWPASATGTSEYCLYHNPNVTKVEIPNSYTSIGAFSFSQSNLTDIVIPNTVTSIGMNAFSTTPIQHVTLPNNITTISQGCFYNCAQLLDITIPNSVTTLERSAFSGAGKLASITWGSSVSTIGGYAFSSCFKLVDLEIPDTVTFIDEYAFQGLIATHNVTIHNNPSLSIGKYAFTKLYFNAPYGAGVTITLTGNTPPTITNTTFASAKIKKIIVPQGTLSTYQTATNWTVYAQYMEEASA